MVSVVGKQPELGSTDYWFLNLCEDWPHLWDMLAFQVSRLHPDLMGMGPRNLVFLTGSQVMLTVKVKNL